MSDKTIAEAVLARRIKERRLPSLTPPQTGENELDRALLQIAEHFRMYEGSSGAPKQRFVTIDEMESSGLITTATRQGFSSIVKVLGEPAAQVKSSNPVSINVTGPTVIGGGGAADLLPLDNTWTGINYFQSGYIEFQEMAAAPSAVAGRGYLWLSAQTPNTLFFRNDVGADVQLGVVPTSITVADESTNTTCFPMFVTEATGDLPPKSASGLTFNSNTDDLSSTLMAGIAKENLVDKAATEAIVGTWTMNAIVLGGDIEMAGKNLQSGGVIFLKEQAAADGDVTAEGQFWVKTATPNEPWFTDDTGVDQLIDPAVSTIVGITSDTTLALSHKGKTIRFTGSTSSQTITIPANSSVAFKVGTLIAVHNDGSVSISLAITTDTLTWAKDNTTGTRTLAAGATAIIHKVASANWKVAGSALVT